MPDPLLSSSGKGLVSIRIIANEKSSVVFLKFCLECHSIVKNRIMFPPGRHPCGEMRYEDRKRLDSGFLRSFFVFEGVAAGFSWLYRRVKEGKPYVKTENQNSVRKGRGMDGGYGGRVSAVFPPVVAAEEEGAEEPGGDGGKGVYGRVL